MNTVKAPSVPIFLPVSDKEEKKKSIVLYSFDVFRYQYESNYRALAQTSERVN